MAKYGIALGGNKRNFPGWDNIYASDNTAGNIGYAAHLKTRHKGLPFEFDGVSGDWQNYFGQEMPTGHPVVADIFDTHYINEGTDVKAIYVHVKKAAAAGTAITVGMRDAANATLGADVAVDLSVPGFIKIPADVLFQTNGTVQFIYDAADLESACFAIIVDLFDAFGQYGCSCDPMPCEVPTPLPMCFSPTTGN